MTAALTINLIALNNIIIEHAGELSHETILAKYLKMLGFLEITLR